MKKNDIANQKKEYLMRFAEDDYEAGYPFDPDDFNEFKRICKEGSGLEMNESDFEAYFEYYNEIKEEREKNFEY